VNFPTSRVKAIFSSVFYAEDYRISMKTFFCPFQSTFSCLPFQSSIPMISGHARSILGNVLSRALFLRMTVSFFPFWVSGILPIRISSSIQRDSAFLLVTRLCSCRFRLLLRQRLFYVLAESEETPSPRKQNACISLNNGLYCFSFLLGLPCLLLQYRSSFSPHGRCAKL